MCRKNNSGSAVYAGELFYGDGIADDIQSQAAPFLGVRDAQQSHFSQLGDCFCREFIFLVQQEGQGFDFFLCKVPDLRPEFLVLLCGLE